MNPVRSIIRTSLDGRDKLNILVCSLDGKFDALLARTGHNFFIIQQLQRIPWDESYVTRPANCRYIDDIDVGDIDFDFVICNDRFMQYQAAATIANNLHIPLLIIDHIDPRGLVPPQDIVTSTQIWNTHSVCVTETLNGLWPNLINYAVESQEIHPKTQNFVLAIGDFQPPHYQLLQQILAGTNHIALAPNVGQTHGEDWIKSLFAQADIFINISVGNTVPLVLLEAMAHGCAIISNNIPIMSDILVNEHNALLANSPEEFRNALARLHQDKALARKLAVGALDTVSQEKYNISTFVKEWNAVFEQVSNTIYKR